MNTRVKKLREQSIRAVPRLDPERALLLTRFYQSAEAKLLSKPVLRAKAFETLMKRKTICINPGELIVGERGPEPKAVPTYPELTTHSLEDLTILNGRPRIPFRVDDRMRKIYEEEIIPYWSGGTIRDRIFDQMSPAWKAAYEAGIFTEFMEQRAPGHTVLDGKIYSKGMLDFMKDIQIRIKRLDFFNDPEAYVKREELRAMRITAKALIRFAERHAEMAKALQEKETDPVRADELDKIAQVCRHVPAHAPRSFWEAIQYYWFVHLGVITELNPWDAFNPGKLDVHLYPFYRVDLERGTLTRDSAKELLQTFWIKFNNQPAPPKVGVTAEESATYTDFAQINIGGVNPDGSSAANEVSSILLEVIDEMHLIQPNPSVQVSRKTPDRFLKKALGVVRQGTGQPSIFNTDTVIEELIRQGKSIQDAREGGTSGCVETGAFGKENYNLTGYFNMPKVLEVMLNNGTDPRTGRRIGLKTGDPRSFKDFRALFDAYRKQLRHFVDIKIEGNNIIERIYAESMPVPFLSLLLDDCIQKGKDYHDGGARYNTSYIQGVGMGSISDAMASIKTHVYDEKRLTMDTLLTILRDDFKDHERWLRTFRMETPKFGNDDDVVDSIMKALFEAYYEAIDGRPNTKGGTYHINLLPTTVHVYFGSVIGAMPDGRKSGEPLSEGISPVQGADRNGPTAVIQSVAKMDHVRTGGTLLNMKFTPQVLAGDEGLEKFSHLVRSYFKLGGHHVQFNVINADTLRAAQENPDKYRNLIVRVAGYSDYFIDLGRDLQDEIIRRTEHSRF